MVVDAFLPLATAAGFLDGFSYWMHWSPGDSPDALRRFLKHAGVANRQNPQSNGWNQGALALFLERGVYGSLFLQCSPFRERGPRSDRH